MSDQVETEKELTSDRKKDYGRPDSTFFDNPLRKEFLTLDQLADFFGYSKQWVRRQMAEGNLSYCAYGRDGVLFYIPQVRQAILDGSLAPIGRRGQRHDTSKKKTQGQSLRSCDYGEGVTSIEELRQLQRR